MITAEEARKLSKDNETMSNTKKLAEKVLEAISNEITACAARAETKLLLRSSNDIYAMLYPSREKECEDKINASVLREIVEKELVANGFRFNQLTDNCILVFW